MTEHHRRSWKVPWEDDDQPRSLHWAYPILPCSNNCCDKEMPCTFQECSCATRTSFSPVAWTRDAFPFPLANAESCAAFASCRGKTKHTSSSGSGEGGPQSVWAGPACLRALDGMYFWWLRFSCCICSHFPSATCRWETGAEWSRARTDNGVKAQKNLRKKIQ